MGNDRNHVPPADAETLRQRAIDRVRALKRENAPRVSDPAWTSYTGDNCGRWADRGFNIALGLLDRIAPLPGETGPDYLERVTVRVRARRDEYRADAEDQDGACSGALDAALWAIMEVVPKEPAPGERSEQPLSDPDPEAEWEIWYRDTFDRESPPSVDARGRGLVEGLMELWARHLFETVRPGGGKGFSRFHLRYKEAGIHIVGSWEGAVHLRLWVYGDEAHTQAGYVAAADPDLLRRIAVTHAHLVVTGQTCEPILAAATEAADRQAFEARLLMR